MKLVIENCKVINALPSATVGADGKVVVQKAEILYMGGKILAENSKKVANGDYSSLSVEIRYNRPRSPRDSSRVHVRR